MARTRNEQDDIKGKEMETEERPWMLQKRGGSESGVEI